MAAVTPDSYTILRVKRKRNEEPLDALVFDAQARKRTKPVKPGAAPVPGGTAGVSVFQFAETVEGSAWDDQKEREKLEARITALAKDDGVAGSPMATSPPPISSPMGAQDGSASSQPFAALRAGGQSKPREESVNARTRRYTIVRRDTDDTAATEKGDINAHSSGQPPKVVPAKSLETNVAKFNMYDAVLAPTESRASSRMTRAAATQATAPAVDSELDKFLPMLQDYLKISEIELAAPAPTLTPTSRVGVQTADQTRIGAEDDEDDYVWDVFYYRPTLSEWNAIAAGNVGSLTGLPPSINNPDESDSEDEPEDEDDEDSNAEDYYKNDYPDEESDNSSDEFHEDSDYDDFLRDEMEDEDHDWR